MDGCLDRTAVRRVRRGEEGGDAAYWRSRPPEERLLAVEALRAGYLAWTDGARPRLQRVWRVAGRA